MESDDVEQWVDALTVALRPALLAQAWMWERLDVLAPPPEELADTLMALLLAEGDSSEP